MHVFDTGLARFISDEVIWDYAKANDYVIVTADSDFVKLAVLRGTPPKVVHLENCNYRTNQLEKLLRRNAIQIAEPAQARRSILVIQNTI